MAFDAECLFRIADLLKSKDEIFERLFGGSLEYKDLKGDEKELADKLFFDSYPGYENLNNFMQMWHVAKFNASQFSEPSETCSNQEIYDSSTKKFIRPTVLYLSKRRKMEKFNLAEFVRHKRDNGDYHQISFLDRDVIDDMFDELNQEKPRNDSKADVALNRMVQMAAILNGSCSYRIMELHPERRVN